MKTARKWWGQVGILEVRTVSIALAAMAKEQVNDASKT